jgi:hypothetical protein
MKCLRFVSMKHEQQQREQNIHTYTMAYIMLMLDLHHALFFFFIMNEKKGWKYEVYMKMNKVRRKKMDFNVHKTKSSSTGTNYMKIYNESLYMYK